MKLLILISFVVPFAACVHPRAETPILDSLRPEVYDLAACVLDWDRACITAHTRNLVAIVEASNP